MASATELDAKQFLEQRGFAVACVWRVESAGDSGEGVTQILYVDPCGKAKTARLVARPGVRGPAVQLKDGW